MRIIRYIPWLFFEIFLLFLSLLLALIYTYPLLINPARIFFGFPGDSLGGIWYLWWLKFSYLHEIPLRTHTYLAYPFGQNLFYTVIPYLFNSLGFIASYFTNEVVTYNILKIAGFPLLSLTTYLLIYYLTKDKLVSAFIGIVYSFAPFHVIHNMAHFANLYWVPLAILFLLKQLNEGGYKNALLLGLFAGVAFVDNAYYIYFLMLLTPMIILAYLLKKDKRVNILRIALLRELFVGLIIFFIIVFPMMYPMIKGLFVHEVGQNIKAYGIARDFSDLLVFSARPLDYLLPSKHNPFLGWLVPDFGISALKGHLYTEHTLYLGFSLMFLSGYALYCAVKKKGVLGLNKQDRWAVYLFFTIAFVAAILSAPPFIPIGSYEINYQTKEVIAEHVLYLPQYFLYKVFPMFRVYARMGAIVLLAVCIVAAFGLRELLSTSNKRRKYAFVAIFFILFVIEYAEFPPFRLTKIQEPEVYKWLASQPENFPIVEYPLGAGDDPYTTYEYFFNQRIHGKYLVNGAIKGTPADKFRKEIIDISKDEAVDKLTKIGVRYILIHKDKYVNGNEYIRMEWLTQPPRNKLFPEEYNDGKIPSLPMQRLRLIHDFGNIAVYEPIEGSLSTNRNEINIVTSGLRPGGGEPAVSEASASMALVLRELRPEGRRGP